MDSIPPGPPAVLGIDLGTSQVKALLVAGDGAVLGQGAAGYQVSTPRDGWAETDPEQWWRATAAAVRSAAGPGTAGVAGIAVVGQMPYLVGERWAHRGSGGAWTGLALAHQRDDLLRAALEGVAFLLRGQLDDLRAAGSAPALVLLAGGGSGPAPWRQLLADALGVPLQPAPVPVGGPAAGWLTARGAALLAAQAAGLPTGAGPPDRSDPVPAVVEPRDTAAAERAYREFRAARA